VGNRQQIRVVWLVLELPDFVPGEQLLCPLLVRSARHVNDIA
jgi:hypothetical protein